MGPGPERHACFPPSSAHARVRPAHAPPPRGRACAPQRRDVTLARRGRRGGGAGGGAEGTGPDRAVRERPAPTRPGRWLGMRRSAREQTWPGGARRATVSAATVRPGRACSGRGGAAPPRSGEWAGGARAPPRGRRVGSLAVRPHAAGRGVTAGRYGGGTARGRLAPGWGTARCGCWGLVGAARAMGGREREGKLRSPGACWML